MEKLNCCAVPILIIDTNPVRAGIVERPEDYRWCSMGFRVRNPKRAKKLLTFFSVSQRDDWSDAGLVAKFKTMNPLAWYRELKAMGSGMLFVTVVLLSCCHVVRFKFQFFIDSKYLRQINHLTPSLYKENK